MFPGERWSGGREFRLGGRKVAPFEHATSLSRRLNDRHAGKRREERGEGKETRLIEINSIARIIIAAYPRIKWDIVRPGLVTGTNYLHK